MVADVVVSLISAASSIVCSAILHFVLGYGERCFREVLWQRICSCGITLSDLVVEISVSTDSKDGAELVAVRRAACDDGMQAKCDSDGGAE